MNDSNGLVLSIFPGIDLLGRAFEEEGYCVVRGPDVLWGGDVRAFHPPAGVFEGVIGGPPCQAFSPMRHLLKHNGQEPRFGNLIPEFERVVEEALPKWFLMENVPDAPIPDPDGYTVTSQIVRDRWVGGSQPRPRRFSFGVGIGAKINAPVGLDIEWAALMLPLMEGDWTTMASHSARGQRRSTQAVLRERSIIGDTRQGSTGERIRKEHHRGSGGKLPHVGNVIAITEVCAAMGLPHDFTDHMPFTMQGKRSVLGNGVPMAMGRAVAQAVRRATA